MVKKRSPVYGIVYRKKNQIKDTLKALKETTRDKMVLINALSKLYDETCNTKEEKQAFMSVLLTSLILRNREGYYQLLLPKTCEVIEYFSKVKDKELLFPFEGIEGSIQYYDKNGTIVKYAYIIEDIQ